MKAFRLEMQKYIEFSARYVSLYFDTHFDYGPNLGLVSTFAGHNSTVSIV